MDKIKILGLFTCFNRKENTVKCMESLLKDKGILWNFVAVDDNSTDGTQEALKSFNEVEVISGTGSCFYSGGMRIAIERAKEKCKNEKYDYVVLLNDDVEFFENAISQLIKYLNNENAVVVGATSSNDGKLSYGGVVKMSSFRPKFKIVMSENNKVECDTFNANCVLIPTNIFVRANNIDCVYRHSLGDFDYGLAIKRMGYKIYVSNFFIGLCNDNPIKGSWMDKGLNRIERLNKKESVKGQPFKIWFHFLNKNYGFITACLYTLNDYFRILLKR